MSNTSKQIKLLKNINKKLDTMNKGISYLISALSTAELTNETEEDGDDEKLKEKMNQKKEKIEAWKPRGAYLG